MEGTRFVRACTDYPTDLRAGNCTYSIEIMGSVTLDEIAGIKDYHKFIHTGTERNVGMASESGCAGFDC